MTTTSCTDQAGCDPRTVEPTDATTPGVRVRSVEHTEGWQALALAVLDRELSAAELTAAERLPVDIALDLLFPDLDDAARHEALWALDASPG